MNDEPVTLTIAGLGQPLRMSLHSADDQIISARLRRDGIWEAYETALTLANLHAGDVYVDVGANIGYYTLLAACRVGVSGRVIAYEPDGGNFALLADNVAANRLGNVELFQLALYDQDREGLLYLSPDNFGDHRVYASPDARQSCSITLKHGGRHLGSLTQRIDFLKIDTQGAEYFVLNGLQQLIAANREHLRMIVELCPWGIRKAGAHGRDLLALLDATGMQYFIIDHIGHGLIPATSQHLADWIDSLDNEPDNEGFINLFVCPQAYAPA